MNSYLVKTSNRFGLDIGSGNIVKAHSVKEAIVKQLAYMKLDNDSGANVQFDVMLMEVIE